MAASLPSYFCGSTLYLYRDFAEQYLTVISVLQSKWEIGNAA